jgi:uncharacterized protein with NRDE domain
MCLIGLALDVHPRFSLVIAANRDEYFDRPAAALAWWRMSPQSPWLLAGRDLSAGGTWLGLADNGRIGMLTNVRDFSRQRADAPSRGALVTRWLDAGEQPVTRGFNPFNLIGGDLVNNRWWWTDDVSAEPQPLQAGVHGLSNASLDTPWPKVLRLKHALGQALDAADANALTVRLLAALDDRTVAPDDGLPSTGVGLERERWLSPSFITAPDGRYGTRCSTVLVGERNGDAWRLSMTERTFDARGRASCDRTALLEHWPHGGARAAVIETSGSP